MDRSDLQDILARAQAALAYEKARPSEDASNKSGPEDDADYEEYYKCPLCDGEGYTDGTLYDAKETVAATVCAYGIGNGLKRAEEFVEMAPLDILALIEEVEACWKKLDYNK